MREYETLRQQSDIHGETNDCAVIALALVTNNEYKTAQKALAQQGRKKRRGTFRHQTHRALGELGFKKVNVTGEYKSKTTKTLGNELKKKAPGRTFLIHATRHALAFKGDMIQDWSADRRKRVQEIYEILPKDAPTVTADPIVIGEERLTILVSENPRRKGTRGHTHFKLYKQGMTRSEFNEARKASGLSGSFNEHLNWDIRHGFVAFV